MAPKAPTSSQGFTLIELIAVVATFALIASMVLPNLDLGGTRAVQNTASDLATALELARERAVMTGREHVVVVDVERGAYWIEWARPLRADTGEGAPPAEGERAALDLVPPPIEGEELVPLEGVFGRPRVVEDPVAILGVEIDGGLADTGSVELRFDGDGATDPAVILLGTVDGEHPMRVELEPLADAVAVLHAE